MTNAATIFMTLFGGVFFLVGLAILISGLSDIGVAENGDQWVLAVMGVIFASAGAGIIFLGFWQRTVGRRLEAARQRHPSEPWMWDTTWQRRRIEHNAGRTSVAMWAFAMFWNAIVITAGAVGWEDMSAQVSEEPAILLVLLFPIVGIGLLVAAVRTTLQWQRFGTSAFVLGRVPVPLGHELEGLLELPRDVRDAAEVVATLRCLRTTRSGKNTTTTVIWSDERRHPRASMGIGPSGPTLAVRFPVPADEPETSVGGGYPSIRWELTVSADIEGVDFGASYPLPVFRTNDTPEPGATRDDADEHQPVVRGSGVVERTIVRERASDGSSVWDFPPLRARSAAAFMTAFTAVWSTVLWFLLTQDVPGFVIAIFGFFELLLIMGTIDVLAGRVTVTIGRNGMLVRSGPANFLTSQQIAAADVARFRVKGSMTVGSTMYHAIEATLQNGKSVTVGKYLRSRAEAEAIVEEMEEELKRR